MAFRSGISVSWICSWRYTACSWCNLRITYQQASGQEKKVLVLCHGHNHLKKLIIGKDERAILRRLETGKCARCMHRHYEASCCTQGCWTIHGKFAIHYISLCICWCYLGQVTNIFRGFINFGAFRSLHFLLFLFD